MATLAAHYQEKAVAKANQNGTATVSPEATKLADHIHRTGVQPKQPVPLSPAANAERFQDIRRARGIVLPEGW